MIVAIIIVAILATGLMVVLSEVSYESGRQSLNPCATFGFIVGDKVIATKRHPTTGDRSFLEEPFIIKKISSHHIILEYTVAYLRGAESTMTIEESKERGFIKYNL